jgi:hypothetical protein
VTDFYHVAAANGHVELVGVTRRPRPHLSTAAVGVVVVAEVVQSVVEVSKPRSVAALLADAKLKKVQLVDFFTCGKIGFLPNGQVYVRARVSGTNLCAVINC